MLLFSALDLFQAHVELFNLPSPHLFNFPQRDMAEATIFWVNRDIYGKKGTTMIFFINKQVKINTKDEFYISYIINVLKHETRFLTIEGQNKINICIYKLQHKIC